MGEIADYHVEKYSTGAWGQTFNRKKQQHSGERFNMPTTKVEKAMDIYQEELNQYSCTHKFAGGMVLHLAPVGESGLWVGTLTAYDKNGLKSEKAVPFNQYIRIVNEVEDLLESHQSRLGFDGKLYGWNPSPIVKEFLYSKKVHRLFFLDDIQVLPFVQRYTAPERIKNRKEDAVEVIVTLG